MATPLQAGAAALYIAAKRVAQVAVDPAVLKTAFANTAHATTTGERPDDVDIVPHQGAGLIDVVCAISTEVTASPAQLYLGDEEFFGGSRRIIVKNRRVRLDTERTANADRHIAAPRT
jgi:hypothetical protein